MSRYRDRIEALAAEARGTRRNLPVFDAADEERALACARDGLGAVVGIYVEARTSDDQPRFDADELGLLHRATSDWLTCWARCHGVDHEADVTVREAAELLVSTHDVTDVARLLTHVPAR